MCPLTRLAPSRGIKVVEVSYPGPGQTVITIKSSAFQSKKARVKLPTGLSSRSSFAEMGLGAVVAISLAHLGSEP